LLSLSGAVPTHAGSFGCVHLVKRKDTEETVVLKIIARPQDHTLNNFIQNEIDVNQKLARLYTRLKPDSGRTYSRPPRTHALS
jgi:serine/threonine protein kinase